jgi:4-hydroxybenzoate polyprenyltransferase
MTDPARPIDAVADAPRGNLVDAYAPVWFRPYARLARFDRPIGWWLLLWPCWWAAALAAVATGAAYPDPWHIFLFWLGAVAMRGAGCTYNDIVDRDIDGLVERTRSRPIPSGQVTVKKAVAFMVVLSLVGLLVLLQFNLFTIVTGLASLGIVAVYPFMKRVTGYPQAVLGLAFAWGALVGWTAAIPALSAAPLLLYAGAIAWIVGYDTIYAHQDREDDALAGLGSTALVFGDRTRPFLVACYGATVLLFGGALWFAGAGLAGYAGLAAFAAHLAWQVLRFDHSDPALCLRLFKSNRDAGWLLFAGLLAEAAL